MTPDARAGGPPAGSASAVGSPRLRALLVGDPAVAGMVGDLDIGRARVEETLLALGSDPPDLLLLDGGLGATDLTSILERTGQPGRADRPAVLVITSDGRRTNVESRLADHPDDFVDAGHGEDVLAARIGAALRIRRNLAELERKNAELRRLTGELEAVGKRTSDELRLASQVQRSLLPPPLNHARLDIASEFMPVREIGGDYFDLIPIGPHRVALALGDVMGKGVPAALLAATLKACLHAQLPGRSAAPAELIACVNRLFWEVTPKGLFASLLFGVFDLDLGSFAYVNAGHEQPIVVRCGGDTVKLGIGGPLLGLVEDARFEEGRVEVGRDDLLVFFSDGVTDRGSEDGQLFGVERLERAAVRSRGDTARVALYSLLGEVQTFSSGQPAEDDMTLVVAKRR